MLYVCNETSDLLANSISRCHLCREIRTSTLQRCLSRFHVHSLHFTPPNETHDSCNGRNHASRTYVPAPLNLIDQATNYSSYVTLLNHYRKTRTVSECRIVHTLACYHGFNSATYISNCFTEMYGNCGSIEDARAVFAALRNPDMFSWHMIMKAYGQNGHVDDAYMAFSNMPWRNDVSWNTMISVFAQNRQSRQALDLFRQMQLHGIKPNKVTFVSLLDACADLAALEEGLEIHSLLDADKIELDAVIGTVLINMYGKCGDVHEARKVFDSLQDHDVVSWTAIIAAFSRNRCGKEALEHFHWMQKMGFRPDKATCICAVDACASLGHIKDGQAVHTFIIDMGYEHNTGVGNALINMYGKCKRLSDASDVFMEIPNRDVVSWTAIVGACAQNVNGNQGLKHFHQMQTEGIMPNKVTFLSGLDTCAILEAAATGQELHTYIHDFGCEGDLMIGNALINMYGKCGNLPAAKRVFKKMQQRDVVCFTSMIAALSQAGQVNEALDLLDEMEREGIKPNDVTFVCSLNACSHTGQISAAKQFFHVINQKHGLPYCVDHYVCMIDLLGRAGHLDEAEDLISQVAPSDATVAWLCLLGACKIHGDKKRAARAASHCHELDPDDVTPYVTLTNILNRGSAVAFRKYAKVEDLSKKGYLHSNPTDRNWQQVFTEDVLQDVGEVRVGSQMVGNG